jgi:hypothetical protein
LYDNDEHSREELREAQREYEKKGKFRRWFHREYKPDVVVPSPDRHNPDLDEDELLEAYRLWKDLGMPDA